MPETSGGTERPVSFRVERQSSKEITRVRFHLIAAIRFRERSGILARDGSIPEVNTVNTVCRRTKK